MPYYQSASYSQVSAKARGGNKLSQVPERFVKDHVKTRLCTFFVQNHCLRGSACKFAHGEAELRAAPDYSRTRFCEVFRQNGHCPAGDACSFAHTDEELRTRELKWGRTLSSTSATATATVTATASAGSATSAASAASVAGASGPLLATKGSEFSAVPTQRLKFDLGELLTQDELDQPRKPRATRAGRNRLTGAGEEEVAVSRVSTAASNHSSGERRHWADVSDEGDDVGEDDTTDADGAVFWTECSSNGSIALQSSSTDGPIMAKDQDGEPQDTYENDVSDTGIIEAKWVVKNSFLQLEPVAARPSGLTRSLSLPALA